MRSKSYGREGKKTVLGRGQGQGREVAGSLLGTGEQEGCRQWMGRPMTSLASQVLRAALLAALLLPLQVKGAEPQRGSPGPSEKSQSEKIPSAGKCMRGASFGV